MTKADGEVYWGQFKADGIREGLGVVTGTDGSVYRGEWRNGERFNQGVLTSAGCFHFNDNS